MAHRRWLIGIVAFAATLDVAAVCRTLVPAQDGLKFLAVARRFQTDPWVDVIRGTDQHPLYPALVAVVQPVAAMILGSGPESWRIAGQGVSVLASLTLLLSLFALAHAVFDERVALIATFIYVLLPVPAEVGRDVLGNAIGLLAMTATLWLGSQAIRRDSWRFALAAGLVGGLGYTARPEAILAPMAVGLAFCIHLARTRGVGTLHAAPAIPALGLALLVCVGGYALAKGQVSEKLALRHAASLGTQTNVLRTTPQPLPPGLERAQLDLSPKEESDDKALAGPVDVLKSAVRRWWDAMCGGFAIMAVWGLARSRYIRATLESDPESGASERLILGAFVVTYLLALTLHGSKLGYLSGRHVLPLVLVSSIWAGAGVFICLQRLGERLPLSRRTWRLAVVSGAAAVSTILVVYQLRTGHESRRGHWQAGRWLAANARPEERILDTRGWARFVADRNDGYDYWHVPQALSDRGLAYVVVGRDELEAKSRRAESLNSLLAYAATPMQDFPIVVEGRDVGTRIYRLKQPVSWEGFAP